MFCWCVVVLESFFVVSNDCAIQPFARMPGCQRIRKPAFAQIVLVLMNDERPSDYGEFSLKQRDFGRGKMKCAITFF